MEDQRTARDQALLRLNVREYGAAEMKLYLKRKGYETAEIDNTVDELVKQGLINDERYSGIIARHSANRGKGPGYIRAKLRQKGVKLSTAEAKSLFQRHSGETELALAQRILETRYPNAQNDFKERQRAYQGLIRRGISHEVAQLCLRS